MTVSITYGPHGYRTDCEDSTGWTEDPSPTLTSTSLTVVNGDVFKIAGDASAGGQSTYWEKDITNKQTATYPAFLVRYRTSASASALKAKVELVFTVGTQVVLSGNYSTTWTTATETITSPKILDKVRFYAVSDASCSGEYVEFDFMLIHVGIFSFPHVAPGGIRLQTPRKDVEIGIPGRDGGVHQKLGMKSPIVILSGDMRHPETWGSANYKYGEYLLKIIRDSDPWQWLESDLISCKVTPAQDPFFIEMKSDSRVQRTWQLRFKQYSLSSLGESIWDDRQWYGK